MEMINNASSLLRKFMCVECVGGTRKTIREVGALFKVSPGFVSQVHQRWRYADGMQSKPFGR
jgi:hypothetical protein